MKKKNIILRLPRVICSSVVRSAMQGDSHGGIYLVDLQSEEIRKVVDWNTTTIDWSGRGLDRGLRGIAIYQDQIVCAASDEVFFFDQEFNVLKSFRNPYLKHCHEICLWNEKLYLTSTGFDAILVFDLKNEVFEKGFVYRRKEGIWRYLRGFAGKAGVKIPSLKRFIFSEFDPSGSEGPKKGDTVHLNNVFVNNGGMYFSGTGLSHLMRVDLEQGKITRNEFVGFGTHNVILAGQTIVYNDTSRDVIQMRRRTDGDETELSIIRYPDSDLAYQGIPNDHARQAFGRGLCQLDDFLIGGSSPSTVSVYSMSRKELVKTVNISMDIRNSIHGLEIYPFQV